jgi:hypothetical protein
MSKPKPMSPSQRQRYNDTLARLSKAIAAWFEVHPGADPQFKFPPKRVVVTGDLVMGSDYWEANADGRALVADVDRETGHEASMLQFQVCYGHYHQRRRRPSA